MGFQRQSRKGIFVVLDARRLDALKRADRQRTFGLGLTLIFVASGPPAAA